MGEHYLGLRVLGGMTALSGMSMIALGALGAHHLNTLLSPAMQQVFDIALRYQAWHTLALLAVLAGVRCLPARTLMSTGCLWLAGMVCFSGSLYAMSLGGYALGWVTPVGGLLLMAGWGRLGWHWLRHATVTRNRDDRG